MTAGEENDMPKKKPAAKAAPKKTSTAAKPDEIDAILKVVHAKKRHEIDPTMPDADAGHLLED